MRNAFFFFFFFWRGAKVKFQVNIHIIMQMVDEFVPSYVPFPMQLLLQSIYLLNICAFMHILHVHTSHMNKIQLNIVLGHECIHNWYFVNCDIFSSNFFWNQYVVDFLWIFFFQYRKKKWNAQIFKAKRNARGLLETNLFFFLALWKAYKLAQV